MEQLAYGPGPGEYLRAVKPVKAAKNVFWVVVGLTVLIQLGAFAAVDVFKVLNRPQPTSTQPQPGLAATSDSGQAAALAARPAMWSALLEWLLPATQFVGLLASVLLSLLLLTALNAAMLGRLPGMDRLASAFVWSLPLLGAMAPWQSILPESAAKGAMFTLGELLEWRPEAHAGALELAGYYGRFVAYPLAVLAVWVIVQARFASGYRRMTSTGPSPAQPAQPGPEPVEPKL